MGVAPSVPSSVSGNPCASPAAAVAAAVAAAGDAEPRIYTAGESSSDPRAPRKGLPCSCRGASGACTAITVSPLEEGTPETSFVTHLLCRPPSFLRTLLCHPQECPVTDADEVPAARAAPDAVSGKAAFADAFRDDPERSPYGFSWFSQQEGVVLGSFSAVYMGNIFPTNVKNTLFPPNRVTSVQRISSKFPWLKNRKDLEFRIKTIQKSFFVKKTVFC